MGVRVLLMRQSYRIIPIYTADVSGVCSALYELGGMTVMHDPSGCNSTYNTILIKIRKTNGPTINLNDT